MNITNNTSNSTASPMYLPLSTLLPTLSPTSNSSTEAILEEIIENEEIHEEDAYTILVLNVCLIGCILLGYWMKVQKMYFLPESAAAILVGVVIGGVARLTVNDLTMLSFSPEVFFFFLLPPIIFEAGYSLQRKHFFDNIGPITLYATFGTMISAFFVGYLTFYSTKIGIISGLDIRDPMEPLLFGSLISAVDPVATLSIMGNPELDCDELLYSLVFGESVLNDAVSIVLFKTFLHYYNPDIPDLSESDIPAVLLSFCNTSFLSICVGVGLGLLVSFIYRHSYLSRFPKLETALLFLFCYLCYATAEALELSGIMALFFHGIILSHYNSYNLSSTAHVTSEQIFATIAVVTETIVFFYMGMGVFTGKFRNWNLSFTIVALCCCLLARALHIFPLSFISNCFRRRHPISLKMQCVLWFAGLRGAIAFALAENMPGPHKDTYASATLCICIFTTVVCGGFTEKILTLANMKRRPEEEEEDSDNLLPDSDDHENAYDKLLKQSPMIQNVSKNVHKGIKGIWENFDNNYLQPLFGGSYAVERRVGDDDLGDYELNRGYSSDGENGLVDDED